MAKDKPPSKKPPKKKERLKPLKLDGVSLEDALRGAMLTPPPKDDAGKEQRRE